MLQYYSLRAAQGVTPSLRRPSRDGAATAARLERERTARLERERATRLERERSDAAAATATAATAASEIAIALHSFTPSTSISTNNAARQISIQRGQRLCVIKHGQNGWTQGVCESTGERGWFPTSYVRVESNNGGLTAGQVAANERRRRLGL